MLKSISDDDICSDCAHCERGPNNSECLKNWPGVTDDDDQYVACIDFIPSRCVECGEVETKHSFRCDFCDSGEGKIV